MFMDKLEKEKRSEDITREYTTYFYVGLIERHGKNGAYTWTRGYSIRSDSGVQPWLTKKEARLVERINDRVANFVEENFQ